MERNVRPDVTPRMPGTDVEARPIPESTQRLAHYVNSLQYEGRTLPTALADDFDTLSAEATGPLGETFTLMAIALRNISQGAVAPETLPVEETNRFYKHETPFGSLKLDTDRNWAESPLNGHQNLRPKEAALLQCLMGDPTAVHNPDEIIKKVWAGIQRDKYSEANLRVLIGDLRGRIGPMIYNIRERGYSLTPTNPEDPNSWLPKNGHPPITSTGELTDVGTIDIIEPPCTAEPPKPVPITVFSGETEITLSPRGQRVYSSKTGEEKRFGNIEFLLLRCLMRNPGIVGFEQIRKDVWPYEPDLSINQARLRTDQLVKRIRNKLGADKQNPIIKGAWGKGYNIAPAANP